jgi:CRP-like cAMP-binding protein
MYPTLSIELIPFLKQIPLFATLSDAQLVTISNDFRLREYRANEIIFHQGDLSDELYIVAQGKVRIFKISPAGFETSIQIFSTYDVVGEFAAIDNQSRSATAKAIGRCQLLEIRGDKLMHYMRVMPDLAIAMTRLVISKVRWTATYAETIAQYDAAGRLLHILLLYNERFGQEIEPGRRYVVDLAMNQADLASLIGARREWVNRLLQDWHKRQLLSFDSGRITILDLPRVIQERDSRIEAFPAK